MEETEVLLAENLLSNTNSRKYVDWAVEIMEKGYESESLFILAGLDNDDSETREKYFNKATKELGFKTDFEKTYLLNVLAKNVAEKVLEKQITPSKGLIIFEEIIRESNFDKKYLAFFDLDEDLDMLNYKNSDRINPGMKREDKDKFICEEFNNFLNENHA
jgi:hypothetical protein